MNSELKRVVPLLLPMRFDEMFHEESRFQTKRENKRRGDTDKCHGQIGTGQRTRRKRLDGYIYEQKIYIKREEMCDC